MHKKITQREVASIAALAKLKLTAEEQSAAEHYLNQILEYAEALDAVATKGVEPFFGSAAEFSDLREDRVGPFADRANLTAGTHFKTGLLVTKPVFERHKDDR